MIIEDRLIPECVMENWFMFQLHMFFKFSAFNEFDQNSDFTVCLRYQIIHFVDWKDEISKQNEMDWSYLKSLLKLEYL